MSRMAELEQRRQLLQLRSERLRVELGEEEAALRDSLGGLTHVSSIARYLASPRALLAGGGVALTFMRPTRAFAWVTRGLVFVSLARRALALVQAFRARS